MPDIYRCIICDFEVSAEEAKAKSLIACPNCDAESIPCNPEQDVTIKINWRELRTICMWAEQWAVQIPKEEKGDGCRTLVYAVIDRLEKQHRELTKEASLSLAAEIRQLADEHNGDVETNFPGIEGVSTEK